LKLQNADTGKKLANYYHASNVKLRPKCAEGPEDTISEEEAAESCLLHLVSRSHSAAVHSQHEGRRQLLGLYFRAISFNLADVEKNHLVVRGRSSCSAYGKCRNWSETWGLSRQNRHRLPEELPRRI